MAAAHTQTIAGEAALTTHENDEGCAACRPAHPSCALENSPPDCGDSAAERKAKRRATLAASLALRGFALHVTDDGVFIVCKWDQARELRSLDAVADFARKVGAL